MSSLLLGEHRGYLADGARLRAFERAIAAAVRPGDAVLDLGSGTGVLGLLALRAGARHVYAVDGSAMAAVARSVLRANGAADRATVLQAHSQRVELPEPVDVVIADQLGAFGVEAGVFEAFADARRRHLAPGGRFVPARIDLVVAAVDCAERWAEIAFWDAAPEDVDLSAVAPLARNVRYFTTSRPDDVLGPPATLVEADPSAADALPVEGTVHLSVERAGTLHGLAGWFVAHLVPGVTMTNSPVADDRIQRSHVFLPIDAPVAVAPGSVVEATVHADPRSELHRWSVTVRDADGQVVAASKHSSVDGMPMTREDLARTRPDGTPHLTAEGEARRTVLTLCDGSRTLREVEAEALARHPDVFVDPADAAAFVRRVLAADAR